MLRFKCLLWVLPLLSGEQEWNSLATQTRGAVSAPSGLVAPSLLLSFLHKADPRSPSLLGRPRCADSLALKNGSRHRLGRPPAQAPPHSAMQLGSELPQAGSRAITLITARPPRRWRARPRRPENAPDRPERGNRRALCPGWGGGCGGVGAREAARADKPAPPLAPANYWLLAALGALAAPFICRSPRARAH